MKPVGIVRKFTIGGIDGFSVELFKHLKEGTELYLSPQTKPLSDEEIHELIVNKVTDYELCRAIEERHGIK